MAGVPKNENPPLARAISLQELADLTLVRDVP
jgi:hypothetical protein